MAGTTIGIGTTVAGYALAAAGYTLTNLGTIGGTGVVSSFASDSVVNAGTIHGQIWGIRLHLAGSVTNQLGGIISGRYKGVYTNGPGTIVNAGSISGANYGIFLTSGSVLNQASGQIYGAEGVFIYDAGGTVTNAGTISSHVAYGVRLTDGIVSNESGGTISSGFNGVGLGAGSVTNHSGGAIYGQDHGVDVYGSAGTVVNAGSISAHYIGVDLHSGGIVTNQSGGTIHSGATVVGSGGIVIGGGGGTVVNAGSISGSNGKAVALHAGFANEVVVDPGATFGGLVDGGNTIGGPIVSTLELASAASAGSLSGIGSTFVNFGSIVLDPDAVWTIAGNPAGFAANITGFAVGDKIELTNLAETIQSFDGSTLILGGQQDVTLNLSGVVSTGPLSGASFIANQGPNGTDISLACFAEGTRIRTTRGAVAVESLRVDDRVPVLMGSEATPITWLGRRRVDCKRHPEPTHVWPIRLTAGAFGPGRPFRDLLLSPDHALFIQGVLIPVRYLVNGRTIFQEARDEVTYWNVELASHNVLYAEGVPVESYLDTGNRGSFANGGPILDLHPEFARRVWEAQGCAPIVVCGPQLATAKRRLLDQAAAMQHMTTDDPNLAVRANGRKLRVATDGRTWRIRLPRSTEDVRLISRRWTPAHMQPDTDDVRTLGVAVSRLWLDRCEVALDSPAFASGWHAQEPEWRWTDGDAIIELAGAREVAFEVAVIGAYWQDAAPRAVEVA